MFCFCQHFFSSNILVSQQLIKTQSQRKKIWKSFSISLLKLNLDIEFDRSLKGTLEFRFEKKSDIQSHKFFVWPYSFFIVEKGEAIYWDLIQAKSMDCSSMERVSQSVSQAHINIFLDLGFLQKHYIIFQFISTGEFMIEPCRQFRRVSNLCSLNNEPLC